MYKKMSIPEWWQNYLNSGMERLGKNPFTQEAFVVRFINILCFIFASVIVLVMIIDARNITPAHASSIASIIYYFAFDILMFLLFIGMTILLRKTRNISLVTSIFLLLVTFGGVFYLLYLSEMAADNLIFVLCVPFIIFLLKGSRKGIWWWVVFTCMVVILARANPAILLTKSLFQNFQFAVAYLDLSLIIFFYQRVNEQYEALAEENQKKLLNYVKTEQDLIESKEIFMNIAAHKLRTPITIIRGTIESLMDSKASKNTTQLADSYSSLERSSKRLLDMVNELLSVLTIEKGTLNLTRQAISVREILEDVIKDLRDLAEQKKVSLIYEPPKTPIRQVQLDRTYITSVITNLITNAISYNQDGGTVTVVLSFKERELQVTVRNTGLSIPQKEHSKVFTKFYRSEKAILKDPNGSGLSLYFTKAFVEAMNGTITFKSPLEDGAGTEFVITFPITAPGSTTA